jgi:hypothetical protein
MKSVPLEELSLGRFSEFLNTRFTVQASPTETMEVELFEATPGGIMAKGGAHAAQYESFSLLFQGSQNRPLQQGTYRFEHSQLGAFDLFIVPIAAEQGVIKYQAVFNRLVSRG